MDPHLGLRLRIYLVDGVGESLKTIDAGNQNVPDAAILQFREYTQPELGFLVLGQPYAQQLLVSLQIDTLSRIDNPASQARKLSNSYCHIHNSSDPTSKYRRDLPCKKIFHDESLAFDYSVVPSKFILPPIAPQKS